MSYIESLVEEIADMKFSISAMENNNDDGEFDSSLDGAYETLKQLEDDLERLKKC